MSFFGEKCPACGARNSKNVFRCDKRGCDLSSSREARVEGNGWQARADEFAASLSVADLEGLLTKRLKVLPGFRALVFQNGQFQGNLPAGEYTLDSFLARFNRLGRNKSIRVVVTREGELPADVSLGDLPSKEYLPLEVELTPLSVERERIEAMGKLGAEALASMAPLRRAGTGHRRHAAGQGHAGYDRGADSGHGCEA